MNTLTLHRISIALLTGVLLFVACVLVGQERDNESLREQNKEANGAIARLIQGRSYSDGYDQGYKDSRDKMAQQLIYQKQQNEQLDKQLAQTRVMLKQSWQLLDRLAPPSHCDMATEPGGDGIHYHTYSSQLSANSAREHH